MDPNKTKNDMATEAVDSQTPSDNTIKKYKGSGIILTGKLKPLLLPQFVAAEAEAKVAQSPSKIQVVPSDYDNRSKRFPELSKVFQFMDPASKKRSSPWASNAFQNSRNTSYPVNLMINKTNIGKPNMLFNELCEFKPGFRELSSIEALATTEPRSDQFDGGKSRFSNPEDEDANHNENDSENALSYEHEELEESGPGLEEGRNQRGDDSLVSGRSDPTA